MARLLTGVVSFLVLLALYIAIRGWFVGYRKFASSFICSSTTEVLQYKYVKFKEAEAENILKVVKGLIKAHRNSRSGKAIYEINEAFKIAQSFLPESNNLTKIETLGIPQRAAGEIIAGADGKEPEICPEIYMGMMYGYPYYYTGFMTNYFNCTGQPLGSLVSVLMNVVNDIPLDDLHFVLKGFRTYYPNISVFVGYKNDQNISQFDRYENFIPIEMASNDTSGTIWHKLATTAETKYLFVGKQMIRFDNHSGVERLVRFLSYNSGDVVGTSHRFFNGYWFRGCHASKMINYTLRYVDGYDLSHNSCIYCNYLTGPFVTRRQMFLDVIDKELDNDMTFVDMFERLARHSKINVLSCPDVMVTIIDKELHSYQKNDWLPLVQKWQLNRIMFTNSRELTFTCEEAKMNCSLTPGLIMPICCLRELVDMMKFVQKTLTAHNISVELKGGSNLGAAKMYGVLPYERDADFYWPSFAHAKFAGLKSEFQKNGYELSEEKNDYSCVNTSTFFCGYFGVKNAYWKIEMWGVNYLPGDEAFKMGFRQKTKIIIDGEWFIVQYSPAAAARSEYGVDWLQHVEHRATVSLPNGAIQSKFGRWTPCPKPGFHGCLDLYLPVGDVQFKDVWF